MNKSITALLAVTALGAIGFSFGKPAYEAYQAKKQLAPAVAAGYAAIVPIDHAITDKGSFPLLDELKALGLLKRQPGVAFMIPEADGISPRGELHIQLPNAGIRPELINQKVIFIRDESGQWRCTTTAAVRFRPANCQNDAPAQPVYLG